MKVIVKKLFADNREGVDRLPGDVFECPKARAEEILEKLGEEYVEIVATKRAAKEVVEG